mmetsp:Transcript_58757/g.177602  ORF Transcript_58757/g.177602 Transcript_58757/m.177602 type:complete len:207 (+) Transcript_58757:247-867(+)
MALSISLALASSSLFCCSNWLFLHSWMFSLLSESFSCRRSCAFWLSSVVFQPFSDSSLVLAECRCPSILPNRFRLRGSFCAGRPSLSFLLLSLASFPFSSLSSFSLPSFSLPSFSLPSFSLPCFGSFSSLPSFSSSPSSFFFPFAINRKSPASIARMAFSSLRPSEMSFATNSASSPKEVATCVWLMAEYIFIRCPRFCRLNASDM